MQESWQVYNSTYVLGYPEKREQPVVSLQKKRKDPNARFGSFSNPNPQLLRIPFPLLPPDLIMVPAHPLLLRCTRHCALAPSPILCMKYWKGLGVVFTTGSPQAPSTTIWRPSWKSTCLLKLAIWPRVWIPTRKSGWRFGNDTLFFIGKIFSTATETAERAKTSGLKTRRFTQAVQVGKWLFHGIFGCDSCRRKRRRWTLWYFKIRWVVLKTYCVTLLSLRLSPRSPFSRLSNHHMTWITNSWFRSCVQLNEIPRAHHEAVISIAWELCTTHYNRAAYVVRTPIRVSRWTV